MNIKKQILIVLFLAMTIFIVGCGESAEEEAGLEQKTSDKDKKENVVEENKIIMTGTPYSNEEGSSVKMNQEISKAQKVARAEELIGSAERIEKPHSKIKGVPEIFFKILKPGEPLKGTSAESRFVWYQNDGSAVLLDHGQGGYYTIGSSEAKQLKKILKE